MESGILQQFIYYNNASNPIAVVVRITVEQYKTKIRKENTKRKERKKRKETSTYTIPHAKCQKQTEEAIFLYFFVHYLTK